jgi:hypothetical protein
VKVTLVPAEPYHVDSVFLNLSEQSLAELRDGGVPVAQYRDNVAEWVANGTAYAIVSEDRTLALFGFVDYGSYLSMWTATAQAGFSAGVKGVLAARRIVDMFRLGKPVYVITPATHPGIVRWLGMLGFSLQRDDRPDGGPAVFRLG